MTGTTAATLAHPGGMADPRGLGHSLAWPIRGTGPFAGLAHPSDWLIGGLAHRRLADPEVRPNQEG